MNDKEILLQIKEIFLHLTDQEPTPDEEIEARVNLIEKFKTLKNSDNFSLQIKAIDDIINKLDKWDTLELWFKEVDFISEDIDKFLKINEGIEMAIKKEPFIPSIPSDKITEFKPELKEDTPELDISKIVFQVTEQFKDEISNLKNTIEDLKKELDKKEGDIGEFSQKRTVQIITPKKGTKLTPPKIRIPLTKKREKPISVKDSVDSKVGDLTKITKSIEHKIDSSKSEELIAEGEEGELAMKIPQITDEEISEFKKSSKFIEKPKLTPSLPEKPIVDTEQKIPFQAPKSFQKELDEKIQTKKLTPLPVVKPEVIKHIKEDKILTPIPIEKQETKKVTFENLSLQSIPSQIPKSISKSPKESELQPISSDNIKEAPEIIEKPLLTPIISKKPKISPISIEEIDTQSIKSSGTDLFNVLSSLRTKSSEQPLEPPIAYESDFMKKKLDNVDKEEKEKKFPVAFDKKKTAPISELPKSELTRTEIDESAEFLAKDKDTLYQELIALEGRRYSLEKSYKDLSSGYGRGVIDEYEFNNKGQTLKKQIDEIGTRISTIRRNIASL
jgi:hypothetical protein